MRHLLMLMIGLIVTPPAIAEDAKPIVLFNGKTLGGWKKTPFLNAGEVKVENGTIVFGVGSSMTGITTTRTDLPTLDYELRYEATRLSGSDFFAAATFPVGTSFLTFVNGGWGGNVTGLSSINGADASENETNRSFTYKSNTWYRFRVRVTSAIIRCWIDDKELIVLEHAGQQLRTRLETRPNQPLGFATWETSGAIRGVEIRKLTPDEIKANNTPGDPCRELSP